MELNEKIQQLRKQKGLTQEELAAQLYVSRTAISKWESGRGCPSIDSLKALAAFFDVTVDELLSGDELLTLAETDVQQKQNQFCTLVFGLLDLSAILLFLLPLFAQHTNETVQAVSLLALTQTAVYLKAAYFAVVCAMILTGIAALALQNCHHVLWERSRRTLSLGFNTLGALVMIVSHQPYAAVFLFLLLAFKTILLLKKQ
ncbi:MAG: helix-turn-helix transcriptional regulator [Clostridia bacterium]|nr:helix-turn-helix transcriptional regulator [Clostridia bacterium]